MFDDVFNRIDFKDILKQLFTSPKYYEKNIEEVLKNDYVSNQRMLLLVYEAVYKYKVIIKTDNYLDEFLNGIETLLQRLNSIEDIKSGICKLIGKLVTRELGINKEEVEENREIILKTIYDRYIKNGYFIRGVSKRDFYNIMKSGISKDLFLDEVNQLNIILSKYNYNLLDEYQNKISFNTDFAKSCLFSINSPIYLYNLLVNNKYINKNKDVYYLKDYKRCLSNLNRVLSGLEVNEYDKTEVIRLFDYIWNYYNEVDNNIYLILVKRSELVSIDEFIDNKEFTFDDALYKILTSLDDHFTLEENSINIEEFIELPLSGFFIKEETKEVIEIEDDEFNKGNKYRISTLFLIFGSLFIIIGVILSIINT